MSLISRLLLISSIIVLCNCSQPAIHADFNAYQQQLASELSNQIELSKQKAHLNFPAPKFLRIEIPETTINLRDLFGLQNCYVSTHIAQRNTALGKVQLPSIRYAYEVALIQGLRQCQQVTVDEQYQQVSNWLRDKQNNLPLVWADMIQNSHELKRTFSGPTVLFTDVSDQALESYRQNINYLNRLYSADKPDHDLDLSLLENKLNALRTHPLASQIWLTQQQITLWLSSLTAQLDTKTKNLRCDTEDSKQKINRLNVLYEHYFVENIIPMIQRLTTAQQYLAPSFERLRDAPVLSNAFRDFLIQRHTDHEKFKIAVQHHRLYWQSLSQKCDLN